MIPRMVIPMLICAVVVSQAPKTAAQAVANPVVCPPVPSTASCLWRVSMNGKGKRQVNWSHAQTVRCPTGTTQRIPTTIGLDLVPNAACAEEPLFRQALKLKATGTTIRRADGLADFYGYFEIGKSRPGSSAIDTIYVSGCIEVLDRVGSHRGPQRGAALPCERCDPNPHSEGWLMGMGKAPYATGTLRVVLVASSPFPLSPAISGPFGATLDGEWLR